MRAATPEIKLGALKDATLQFLQDEAEEEVAHVQSHSAQPVVTDPRLDQLTKAVAELAAIVNNQAQRRNQGCYHCGESGHFKRNCPTLRKKQGGN